MPRPKKATVITQLRAGKEVPYTRKKQGRRRFGKIDTKNPAAPLASYPDPDGRVEPNGQRTRYYKAFTTIGDADAWLDHAERQIKAEPLTWKPPTVIQADTFGEYADVVVAKRRITKGKNKGAPLSPKYRILLERNVTIDLAPLRSYQLSDITAPIVRNWHHKFAEQHGDTTAGIATRGLNVVMNQAVADEIIPKNPVPKGLGNSSSNIPTRNPTETEIVALLDWFQQNEPRLQLALIIAGYGGERLSEWRALRRNDLTLKSDGQYYIRVERQAQQAPGGWIVKAPKWADGEAPGEIALPDWTTDYVTHHLNNYVGRFGESLLFEATVNEQVKKRGAGEFISTAWETAWDKARDAVGIKRTEHNGRFYYEVREHDLRHFFGTELAKSGLGIKQLQGAGRWKTPDAAMKYLASVKGADAATANRLRPPVAEESNVTQMRVDAR